MKNRFISIILLTAVIFAFPSCAKNQIKTAASSDTVKITATFYPLYITLLNLTKDVPDVEVSMLAPSDTGCLHDYQLTTKDMKKISLCDILVVNGAGMEDFLEKVLSLKADKTIIASEGFPLIDDNPHIWVNPIGAAYQSHKITEGLCSLDEKHASRYRQNNMSYTTALYQLSNEMHKALDPYEGKEIITFHEAFPYFAAQYNLKTTAVIEREPGTVPSAKELNELILSLKEIIASGTKPVLYAEPQYSSKSAQIIAKETGLTVYTLDPCVTGKLDKDAYLNSMRKNLSVLTESLSR